MPSMGQPKNAMFADVDQKRFALVTIQTVRYPNDTALFTLTPTSGNPNEQLSISANPAQFAAELRRIADWLESSLLRWTTCSL